MPYGRYLCRGILVLLCWSFNGLEAAASPLNDYKRALVKYYGAVHFHPLLLPQGHRVGDVIDSRTLAVVRKQAFCFPGLRTDRTEVSLPSIMLLENRAARFWVRLKYMLGLQMSVDDTRQVLLNLEDVSVESATLGALRDTLGDQCSELSSIFEHNRMPRVMGRRVNIVASILKGRANTVCSYSRGSATETKLQNLVNLLANTARGLMRLPPELAAEFGLSKRINVIDVAEVAQTVAYRPATIFRPLNGAGEVAKDSGEIHVMPFDSENADHRKRLGVLTRAWAESPGK